MHDPTSLLQPGAATALARRQYELPTALTGLIRRRAELIRQRDELRGMLNRAARAGSSPTGQSTVADDRQRARSYKEDLQKVQDEHRRVEEQLRELLLEIPNLPADDAPDGGAADPPVEVRRYGQRPEFDFPPRDHTELGTAMGILDPVRAAKLAGPRFAVTRAAGAQLERALAAFLLDLHTREHGYLEYGLPHLVNAQTMTATGQLPKFAEDLFSTSVAGRELLLIPTAEVPLVNLYRDQILDERDLPIALTAHTACYRAEAGSYGRDTKGLIRLHQFDKVELVRLCTPERAEAELELLLGHAEEGLRRLGLHYRVVQLRAGDLGFSARRTYDIEVWLPGQQQYREISSCSDCGTFQGRRAAIRIRYRDGRKSAAATLNGSGLPIGRTMVALLEQHQRADGSVTIPPALRPYTGFSRIAPDGSTLD